ncbi:MAG: hypothetical protein K2N63_17680 [Lachnospiraceae bacterium]|nr:hypothetical protein [Lachnospiraceae bacterium]
MIKEYKIQITGEYNILVLSPEMIALLIKRVRNSDTKELIIPAKEILPEGYAEYLNRVLATNLGTRRPDTDLQEVYQLIAKQIKKLSVNQQECFSRVDLFEHQYKTHFNLSASETFFILVKQGGASFTYIYNDSDERQIKLTLLYQ